MQIKLKRLFTNLLVLALSIAVGLLLCEGVLRLLRIEDPCLTQGDRTVGFRHLPNAEGWWQIENKVYVRINSDGLRDREHLKKKPEGTVRIAVLGDSYAEAFQVPLEDTFWAVAERELDSCKAFGDRTVEVINFGVSGYSTVQELLTLRKYGWDYAPDIVILAFFSGNDLRDNSRSLTPFKVRPFFRLEGDSLVLDTSFVHDPGFEPWRHEFLGPLRLWLSCHFRLYQFLVRLKLLFQERQNEVRPLPGAEIGIDLQCYLQPTTNEWKEAWAITESLIRRMSEEVRARGVRFVVVTLSTGSEVHPDSLFRRAFMDEIHAKDLSYADRRVQSFCQENGIEVLRLDPILLEYAQKNHVALHGFFGEQELGEGHYNRIGHRVAGEALAAYFCKNMAPTHPSTERIVRNTHASRRKMARFRVKY